jgi:hypothetical protein
MNWQEADVELSKRVKKFRYDNPHTPYNEAVNIILEDDPELAVAYTGVDSPLTSNIVRQFELDRLQKKNPEDDLIKYQYRVTAAHYMGWRSASKTYGIDVEREIKEKIQREIMELENKQILFQKAITEKELTNIEAQLNELHRKLGKIEDGKKFSQRYRFESPSAELVSRAKKYSRDYSIDYETAVADILGKDIVLATAYNLYSIDELLGL